MDKKKLVLIISIILVSIVIVVSTIIHFSSNNSQKVFKSYICQKQLMEKPDYNVYLIETIYYNDNQKIEKYDAKTEYTFNNNNKYLELKKNLSNCNDTYKDDKKITCIIENKEEQEKSIVGSNLKQYIDNLEEQQFSCKEQ